MSSFQTQFFQDGEVGPGLDFLRWVAGNRGALALVINDPMLRAFGDEASFSFQLALQFARLHTLRVLECENSSAVTLPRVPALVCAPPRPLFSPYDDAC